MELNTLNKSIMNEIQKAEETLAWLNYFDLMRRKINSFATSAKEFDSMLKSEINKQRTICNNIITPPEPTILLKKRKQKIL